MTTQHCIIFPLVTMGVLVLTRDVQSDWIANRDLKKGCPYPPVGNPLCIRPLSLLCVLSIWWYCNKTNTVLEYMHFYMSKTVVYGLSKCTNQWCVSCQTLVLLTCKTFMLKNVIIVVATLTSFPTFCHFPCLIKS